MANKNSTYLNSLVSFILDTKPYRCKLTEVVEEYRFAEQMTVGFDERLFSSVLAKAAWPYSFFSSGVSTPAPLMPLHRVTAPLFRGFTLNSDPAQNRGAFKVGRDESTDLPLVPLAFDPKAVQGVGLADAFVQRQGLGTQAEALLEGHDVHLSHGAYVVDIKQTVSSQPLVTGRFNETYEVDDGPFPITVNLPFDSDSLHITGPAVQVTLTQVSVTGPGAVKVTGLSATPNYAPLITERRNQDLLAAATAAVQAQALDVTNPTSAINRIQAVLDAVATQLLATPDAASSAALAAVQAIIDTVNLPSSYEALLDALVAAGVPVINGYVGWRGQDTTDPFTDPYVDQALAACSTSLFFNAYTDVGQRESGALAYADVRRADVRITDIVSDPMRAAYEEWTLEAVSPTTFLVRGSVSGPIGSIVAPGVFTAPQLRFEIELEDDPVAVGTVVLLTPRAALTVHLNAPLEAWSLIKVNPIAYTRPELTSTRYGHVVSQTLEVGRITVLDTGLPTGTLTLTATSSTSFTLSSTAEPLYTGVITVGVPFNDGRVAFTIMQGGVYTFQAGDRFYIEIENRPPEPLDLDLYYGFDTDPFDANELVYNNVDSLLEDYLTALGFGFDSRFINYDVASFGLTIASNAVNNRRWRLRALADLARPLRLQASSPTNLVNLLGTDDPTNPAAATLFDTPNSTTSEGIQSSNDPDSVEDLRLWYAGDFALERYDEGTGAWVTVDTVAQGVPYVNATHGLSFTIVPAAAPFIAARLHSSWYPDTVGPFLEEDVDGGDMIAWTVRNEDPTAGVAALVSPRAPRLVMHADSFHHSTPALWALTWTSGTQYTVQGTYTTGPSNGSLVFSTPPVVDLTTDGRSYRNDDHGLHFTVVPGAVGLAATDTLRFETLARRPSYLVHGSVSGWQPDAVVGEWYWNGRVGFKLRAPEARLFEAGERLAGTSSWTTSVGLVTLERLRLDAPASVYHLSAPNDGRWLLRRDGEVVGAGADAVADTYVRLDLPTAVAGTELTLHVQADTHALALGTDLAIVRTTPGRAPQPGDFTLFSRTERDQLSVSIRPKDGAHAAVLSELAPVTIDLRFVDHTTGSGVPLANTSPETAVLPGWIPALSTYRDSALSTAEFSDPATSVVLTAAASGETIGTVEALGATVNDTVVLRWDAAFAAKYLPLNAEATVVTLGSGLDDRVAVRMTEGLALLVSGGGLDDTPLFTDAFTVHVAETSRLAVLSTYAAAVGVAASDGPFVGFMPGFGNLPFDFELGGDPDDDDVGYFDAGQALTGWFSEAKALDALPSRTPPQQARLNELLGLLGGFLDGDLAGTTLAEFTAVLNALAPVSFSPVPDFGLPTVGLGIDVLDQPTGTAGPAIEEAMTVQAVDQGYPYDLYGYDVGGLDDDGETTVILLSNDAPPLPVTGLPAPSTTYAAFQTPLHVTTPCRVVELSFTAAVVTDPAVHLWRPSEAAPSAVPIVERLGPRLFRFSLPSASELKLIVS